MTSDYSEPAGTKPSEADLKEASLKIEEETAELKRVLTNERLALIEKRLVDIDKGRARPPCHPIHPVTLARDEEWNQKMAELQELRERRLNVARERYRMHTESIIHEYEAAAAQISDELQVRRRGPARAHGV